MIPRDPLPAKTMFQEKRRKGSREVQPQGLGNQTDIAICYCSHLALGRLFFQGYFYRCIFVFRLPSTCLSGFILKHLRPCREPFGSVKQQDGSEPCLVGEDLSFQNWCISTSSDGKGMWWQRWEQGRKRGTSLARRKTLSRHLGLSARHFQFPSICQTEIVGGHVKPSKAESQQNKINSYIHRHKSISIFIIGPYRSLYIMGQVAWASTNFFPG